MIGYAIVAVLLVAPLVATAGDIYRCMTAEGKTIFTDQPCPKSAAAERINVRPASPSPDAQAASAERLARDNADFNARFDAREKAKADSAAEQARADAWEAARRPIIIERPAPEPVYIPYAVTTCGGPGQPKCQVKHSQAHRKPTPPPSIPAKPKPPQAGK